MNAKHDLFGLSDMRTVRRQGPTFRITQPHGLRITYLLMPPGLHKGETEYSLGHTCILVESYHDSFTLPDPQKASNLQFVTTEKYDFTIFMTQEIS